MPYFIEGNNVEPLTAKEKRWCHDLEKLLLDSPTRFGFYTIGDAELNIYDRSATKAAGIPEEECEPGKHGYGLASVRSREQIQGWCG